jgi:high-affinity iron transporter
MPRQRTILAAVATLFATLAWAGTAQAATPEPWKAAADVRSGLRAAGIEVLTDDEAAAASSVRRAAASYRRGLEDPIERADASADASARAGLRAAERSARRGDAAGLAAARGTVAAALLRGSAAVTLAATARGDAEVARRWLLLRDFRTATRFTRPGADATLAIEGLGAGRIGAKAAQTAVVKDLLDGYQARMRELLDDANAAAGRGFVPRQAEAAAQAAGYWRILRSRYAQDRGEQAAKRMTDAVDDVARAALSGDEATWKTRLADVTRALDGFTAAPFTQPEAARRAQQLLRFLALVPVEYDRGVSGTRVTLDFEIQEAVAFRTGAAAAFTDLKAMLARRDAAATAAVQADLEKLRGMVAIASERTEGVPQAEEIETVAGRAEDALDRVFPPAWKEQTDESDYDLIALTLDRMEAAVGAAEYRKAEQARLEAYAFFEFGPERRLKAFDPGLAIDVEGLIWFGARDKPGLAELIAKRAARRQVRETRLVLDEALSDAAATLGDSANKATVVTNSAILVFREGLEAVLILAAITASFVGARRRLRRPIFIGALLGLVASGITWLLAQTLLQSLDQFGEKLEAVVGLVAIGVLLLVTNWFFHRVYWSEWIGRFHRQRKRLEKVSKTGFISAQALGLLLLGLSSVYREGFETVLFLQSLELSAGTATVLEGTALGLLLTFAVAAAVFLLERKLPYKKMLIFTGVMIGVVLVVMVGQTARTMQGTGWLPITSIDIDLPYWLGLWFGVFPTVETMLAQVIAAIFVIGSYLVAQEVRVKRPRRKAGKVPAPTGANGNGSGAATQEDLVAAVEEAEGPVESQPRR